MNHKFKIGTVEPTRCESCGYNEIDHTERATCDTCGNTGTCDLIVPGMLQCMDCIAADAKVDEEKRGLIKGHLAESVQSAKEKLEISKQYDQTIRVSPDLFNAKMQSILELKAVIDADDSVPNKDDLLADTIDARFKHLSKALFEINETTKEYHAEQRAILIYWNELRKRVSEEKRALIKMQDVQYQPVEVKTKTPKAPGIKKPNMAALKKAAAESGFSMVNLQSTCVSRNLTPDEAVKYMMDEMIKKLNPPPTN